MRRIVRSRAAARLRRAEERPVFRLRPAEPRALPAQLSTARPVLRVRLRATGRNFPDFRATTPLPRNFPALARVCGAFRFLFATKSLPQKPAKPCGLRLCGFSQGDAISAKGNFFEPFLPILSVFQTVLQLFENVWYRKSRSENAPLLRSTDPRGWKF